MLDACYDSLYYHACWMPAVIVSGAFMCNLQLDKPQAPVSSLLLHMLDACYASIWCLHMQRAAWQATSSCALPVTMHAGGLLRLSLVTFPHTCSEQPSVQATWLDAALDFPFLLQDTDG